MPDVQPIARSPIRPAEPVLVHSGWEVSARRSRSTLRLADHTPLTKALVRAEPGEGLGVSLGHAERDEHGTLVVGRGLGEWMLLSAPDTFSEVAARLVGEADIVDLTHGRALVRLTGETAASTLSKVCAIDLSDRVTPHGAAFRSAVAKVATDVVRDDAGAQPSYLLHCERSIGQYLFDVLLDAGREFGIDQDGFSPDT